MKQTQKMGRPIKRSLPLNKRLHIRISENYLDRLDLIAQKTGRTRSDLVIEGIEKMFKKYE